MRKIIKDPLALRGKGLHYVEELSRHNDVMAVPGTLKKKNHQIPLRAVGRWFHHVEESPRQNDIMAALRKRQEKSSKTLAMRGKGLFQGEGVAVAVLEKLDEILSKTSSC